MDNELTHLLAETPLGTVELALEAGRRIRALSFCSEEGARGARSAALDAALAAWFARGEVAGGFEVAPQGTAFQRQVWQAVSRVGRGCTTSYAALAASMDRPGSARAVARALAANPVLLLVPCHRVIGGDGRLRGYAGGIERKRALLALEQGTR